MKYGDEPWKGELYREGIAEFAYFANRLCGKNVDITKDTVKFDLLIGEVMKSEEPFTLYRFLKRVLLDSAAVYYSHPGAWDKIGFPGPAYPEGYGFLSCDKAEGWEPKYFENKK